LRRRRWQRPHLGRREFISSKRGRTGSLAGRVNNSILYLIARPLWPRLACLVVKPNQSNEMVAAASRITGPEVALAKGVLAQAKQDLRRFQSAQDDVGREIYADAYSWVTADDFSWPYSFQNVCKVLGISPESTRVELLPRPRAPWFSRPRRIAETISSSLRRSLGSAFKSNRSGGRQANRPAVAH
jgi:hypothetical protein